MSEQQLEIIPEHPSDSHQAQPLVRKPRHAEIAEYLDHKKQRIEQTLAESVPTKLFLQYAMNEIRSTPALQECTLASIYEALVEAASMRLLVGKRHGYAYLVPFWSKKAGAKLCTLIVGYRGMVALCYRSRNIEKIETQTVHDGDDFEISYGKEGGIRHRPDPWGSRTKENCLGAYCIVTFKDGTQVFERMTYDEIEIVRKRSKGSEGNFWTDWWLDMARKSVVRKIHRWLPLEPELLEAILADEQRDLGDEGPRDVDASVVGEDGGAAELASMMLHDNPDLEAAQIEADRHSIPRLTSEQEGWIGEWIASENVDPAQVYEYCRVQWSADHYSKLTQEQALDLLEMMRGGDFEPHWQ